MIHREQEIVSSQIRTQILDGGEDIAKLLSEPEQSLKALAGLNFKCESAYLALVTARLAFQGEDIPSAIEALQETIEHLNDLGVREFTFRGLPLSQGSDRIQ